MKPNTYRRYICIPELNHRKKNPYYSSASSTKNARGFMMMSCKAGIPCNKARRLTQDQVMTPRPHKHMAHGSHTN